MKIIKRQILLSMVFSLFLLYAGCVATYTVSENSIPSFVDDKGDTIVGERPRRCTLKLPDIDISIAPINATLKFGSIGVCLPIIPIIFPFCTESVDEEPLIVNVVLAPKTDTFTFAPMQVQLIINNSVYTPVSYKGPLPVSGGIGDCDYLYRHDYHHDPYTSLDVALSINGPSCFELQFPIATSDTKKEFMLELLGIKKDGEDFEIPELIFRRGHQSDGGFLG